MIFCIACRRRLRTSGNRPATGYLLAREGLATWLVHPLLLTLNIVKHQSLHLNDLFVPEEGTAVTGMLCDNLLQSIGVRDDSAVWSVLL